MKTEICSHWTEKALGGQSPEKSSTMNTGAQSIPTYIITHTQHTDIHIDTCKHHVINNSFVETSIWLPTTKKCFNFFSQYPGTERYW